MRIVYCLIPFREIISASNTSQQYLSSNYSSQFIFYKYWFYGSFHLWSRLKNYLNLWIVFSSLNLQILYWFQILNSMIHDLKVFGDKYGIGNLNCMGFNTKYGNEIEYYYNYYYQIIPIGCLKWFIYGFARWLRRKYAKIPLCQDFLKNVFY